ncbi:heme ABC exporter ATP-binding protein CcmA [Epibacterium sp. Ofav1-8]|uniref:heme ABC exporter ATP-binding protein CcmA n=1 Tax=Epibacterium sp. Ofav1-8 TaxID=2917735 RepID=UPI001EF695B2|nr:heme ABC exporter ATP-binding protein CcmA [Epibacterium sp. Ofav1-8]MCG7622459.1 heme ABC exporter ATP-binding protein CcmA [Epibacterium sp. Ofav1-8]
MIEVRDLGVSRGGMPVLSGVQFTLSPGEALVLRGPNGIGKTTLLRTLARLQPPLAGEILGDSEDIAYAAHADGLKLTLTVDENLAFWARVFGGGDPDAAIAAFDLATLRDRPAGGLSAGQKRRLSLARLMVTGRRLWILDEPTVSLDAASVQLFAATIRTHLAAGGAAIMATHIDLGIEGRVLDLAPFKAKLPAFDADDAGGFL